MLVVVAGVLSPLFQFVLIIQKFMIEPMAWRLWVQVKKDLPPVRRKRSVDTLFHKGFVTLVDLSNIYRTIAVAFDSRRIIRFLSSGKEHNLLPSHRLDEQTISRLILSFPAPPIKNRFETEAV